jgi:hypothetical protein
LWIALDWAKILPGRFDAVLTEEELGLMGDAWGMPSSTKATGSSLVLLESSDLLSQCALRILESNLALLC